MRPSRLALLALVAVVQSAVLAYMVWDRASLLASGREVLLQTAPVDPRSLFRGDYVILSYPIGTGNVAASTPPLASGEEVYVTLEPGADGFWQRTALARTRPAAPAPNQVVVKGRVESAWPTGDIETVMLHFGIESYFVPEGEGKDLEKLVGTESLAVVAAVGEDGRAAIKGLRIGGTVRYDEPLF